MIAVDSNLLVYAHRADGPWHEPAAALLRRLAEGAEDWAIPWPCLHEFLGVVTHPRAFRPPSTPAQATAQARAWMESPRLSCLADSAASWEVLERLLISGRVTGPLVHDARIAALCIANDVEELWTADRDFGRFPELRTRNPLVA